ncbi:hypothetical protein [uncultured Roseibium sp.]|uniref:hypothetical protein n=1 Tax=uncultured Roseibium sp. TaxID=1936171 RepID=UPI0032170C28
MSAVRFVETGFNAHFEAVYGRPAAGLAGARKQAGEIEAAAIGFAVIAQSRSLDVSKRRGKSFELLGGNAFEDDDAVSERERKPAVLPLKIGEAADALDADHTAFGDRIGSVQTQGQALGFTVAVGNVQNKRHGNELP